MNVHEIITLLAGAYGPPKERPLLDPLSELVYTVLSQNTSDRNSRRAFASLIATFGDWQAVADSDPDRIADAIKSGGLSRVKAVRIKEILHRIKAEHGSFDLTFLGRLPVEEAKSWLRQMPGVGPKTVACVLLFSLGKPVLPVDTHVYRVSRRLGLVSSRVSVEKAHETLAGMVQPEDTYTFHMLMVEHGRRTCKAQRPLCSQCVLLKGCLYGQALVKGRPTAGK